MSLLTENRDMAIPLRLSGYRSTIPIAKLLKSLNPLNYIEYQPVVYRAIDTDINIIPIYELSVILNKCAEISDEEKCIAELPPEWFLLISQLDHLAFSFIDEWMDPRDKYDLPSNFEEFPYQELFDECKHILELDIESIFQSPGGGEAETNTDNKSSEVQEQSSNIFRQNKIGPWEVRFNGKSYPNLEHRVGFQYIRQLLASPGKEFSANEIDYSGVPDTSDVVKSGVLTEVDYFSSGDVPPDETAIMEYKVRLLVVEELIREAIKNDDETHKKLEDERDLLKEQVNEAHSARIRAARGLPQDGSIQKKTQDKINSNIKNAIKYIDEHIPKLGKHLEESIRKGAKNYYKPSTPTTWVVS